MTYLTQCGEVGLAFGDDPLDDRLEHSPDPGRRPEVLVLVLGLGSVVGLVFVVLNF